MGCLFAVFTLPYTFIRWVIANGWKGVIVLVVVLVVSLVGFFVISAQVKSAMAPKPTPALVAAPLPSVKAAPFLVETPTRTYYALKAAANKDGTVTMTDWWEFLKGKWTLTKGTLVLDKTFGQATIRRR
jgi:hypothetical protein